MGPPISQPRSFTAEEWEQWNQTPEGSAQYHWWADWIPTHEGQVWCYDKRIEARCVVDGMIRQWGLDTLCSGEGVIDIGGDPGFLAVELLRSGIPATVVDPAFGYAGKQDHWTACFLQDPSNFRVRAGAVPLRILREPFDDMFIGDPEKQQLLQGAAALVSLYPDEGTNFIQKFSAAKAMRMAMIPCNECAQYFPPHEPTYEGFVRQLLLNDRYYLQHFGQHAPLVREMLCGTPFCRVLLQRTPPRETEWGAANSRNGNYNAMQDHRSLKRPAQNETSYD